MGKSCIVCKSCSDKRPELIYHGFPKDEKLRKTWIENMGITKEISKFSAICSIHFTGDCFRSTMISKRPVLIRGSIPTILTEEELLQHESMQDGSSSDSTESMNSDDETNNFHSEHMPEEQSSSQFESTIKIENADLAGEDCTNYEILGEFSPPRELQSDSETDKMIEELQYSCRKIRVKGLKWEDFRRLPEILQEMHWTEAQHLIEEQSREIRSLQQKNRRATNKIENLTLFTQSMKQEIAKRARNHKIESSS